MQSSSSGKPLAAVTGASSGIGKALAREFAQNGYDLVIAAEDGGIESARSELQGLGAQVQSVQTNLATYDGTEKFYDAIRAAGRPLDAIAINAGIGSGGAFTQTDLNKEIELLNLNVISTVHLAKRVVRDMVRVGRGRMLFTSSIAAIQPDPFEAVYGASKAFVRQFAMSLRDELKDSGVTVTTLMPGPTETNFFNRAEMNDTKVGTAKKDDPQQVAHQGFEAMMQGDDDVIAGSMKTKMQAGVIEMVPDGQKAKIHRSMAEPGSGQ